MGRGQRFELQASWFEPRGPRTGVTGAGCWIWIEMARGVGRVMVFETWSRRGVTWREGAEANIGAVAEGSVGGGLALA